MPEAERRLHCVLLVHGGAGVLLPDAFDDARRAACHAGLEAALRAGHAVWREGAPALDIVCAAVRVLEDDPQFNAGRGSVLTHDGTVEMDAAIMRGSDRLAGAVAGLTTIRNPVLAARAVAERTPFVFLAGPGAESFAREQGLATEPPDYFLTDERRRQLEVQRARNAVSLSEDGKFGTVGAVALDRSGSIAAATSTGGMTNKRHGRIGDTPVIGAGTWADDATCAVSATGHGEFFLRSALAHEIAARMAFAGQSVSEAAREAIFETLPALGGSGGVIALDRHGTGALTFNSPGMFRGAIGPEGRPWTGIFDGDPHS